MTTAPVPIQPIGDGINENARLLTLNGSAPIGQLQRVLANFVRYRQHQGRPLMHFWGGWDDNAAMAAADTFRMARFDMLDGGCAKFGAIMHTIGTGNDITGSDGIYIGGVQTADGFDQGATTGYPEAPVRVARATTPTRAPATSNSETVEKQIGFVHVYPMAGCFFEDAVTEVVDPSTTLTGMGFGPARDIIATQTSNYGTLARLVDRFMHVWKNRRITYGWFTQSDSYVEFDVERQSFRYIMDQNWGTDGTAPSNTGPGLTLPHRFSAAGLETSIRVYVWVLAAMSGNTDSGTIAIANKDTSGVMSAMTPLVNPQTIGGTGYAWYPSLGSFDPTATPYFVSPTNQHFDRVLLGGRSEGGTDTLRIRGFLMAVYPDRQ